MRQCPDRYAFRAGRNLPDKEFRYLTTVIVTAAVYWGLQRASPKLTLFLLTFQHRAGVSPYTSSYDFAETCVFDKQSPGPFHCGWSCDQHPFSRSYGGHFAEFLNESSLAHLRIPLLDYLCRFAVRAVKYSLEAFLGSVTSATSLL